MPTRRRQKSVKRARHAHCTRCGRRGAVWSFRLPPGGKLAAELDDPNRKLALLCRRCFDAARDDPDFESLNAGAAERLRLPGWYDDQATAGQRSYIAALMESRGLGELKRAEALALRKGRASEMIDELRAMPAVPALRPAAEESTTIH